MQQVCAAVPATGRIALAQPGSEKPLVIGWSVHHLHLGKHGIYSSQLVSELAMPISPECKTGIHSTIGLPNGPIVAALSPVGEPTATGTGAQRWVLEDGRVFWTKSSATDGLFAELVAGRLAYRLGIGPVVSTVLIPDGRIIYGCEDVRNAVNTKELSIFLPDLKKFDLAALDQATLGRVFVFQVWIGHADPQWLIDQEDGRVYSIDHEVWTADAGSASTPELVSARMPGMPGYLKWNFAPTLAGIDAVEALSDEELVESVSSIPAVEGWEYHPELACDIANGLADRRDALRKALEAWLTT